MAKQRPLGFAVIGLGHIAQSAVLPAFAHAKGDARLVALVSGDRAKRTQLAKKYRVPHTYTEDQLDACLANPDVDAIYVCTPNTKHTDVVTAAARAGVHVLCEKPMATTEGECQAMIAACRDADVRLMIAYRLHFDKPTLAMVELVERGAIGEPKIYAAEFGYQLRPGNIRTQRGTGGGAIWDIGIYCINGARMLFRDEPTEVMAFSGATDKRFEGVDEITGALLRFPGGRLASFVCSFNIAATDSIHLVGTKGELRLNPAFDYAYPRTLEATLDGKKHTRRFAKHDQFAAELVAFAEAVREGHDPEPAGEEGLADVRIIRAIQASARAGRAVPLAPFERHARPEPGMAIERPPLAREPKLVHVEPPVLE